MAAVSRLWRHGGIEVVRVRAPGGSLAYDRHFHDDWVIGVNLTGREHLWLDHRHHDVAAGTITAYAPGAVQAGRFEGPAADFVSLYVSPDAFAAIAAEVTGRDGAMVALAQPVIDDTTVATALVRLAAPKALEEAGGSQMEALEMALGDLIRRHADRPPLGPCAAAPDRLARAAEYLRATLDRPVDLAELAAVCGLSRYHLARSFHARHGLPPRLWHQQLRVAAARRMLDTGTPIAETAAVLGFADQSHLTTAFRRVMGTTPARWRKGVSPASGT